MISWLKFDTYKYKTIDLLIAMQVLALLCYHNSFKGEGIVMSGWLNVTELTLKRLDSQNLLLCLHETFFYGSLLVGAGDLHKQKSPLFLLHRGGGGHNGLLSDTCT